MSRNARTTKALMLGALLVLALATPSLANIHACCLPGGGCQDTLIQTCDDLGGASLVGRMCLDAPCTNSAPLLSPLGLLVLLIGVSAIAVHRLRRRPGAR